jgi:CRP-like cAMP-binding protein
MVGLGRRSAHQRIAHVLCEMALRFKAVGLGDEGGYELPATQAELADALGLTAVHVNRVLQDLRRSELIVLRGRTLTILDWDGLQHAGEFDPGYLHQDHGRPA